MSSGILKTQEFRTGFLLPVLLLWVILVFLIGDQACGFSEQWQEKMARSPSFFQNPQNLLWQCVYLYLMALKYPIPPLYRNRWTCRHGVLKLRKSRKPKNCEKELYNKEYVVCLRQWYGWYSSQLANSMRDVLTSANRRLTVLIGWRQLKRRGVFLDDVASSWV